MHRPAGALRNPMIVLPSYTTRTVLFAACLSSCHTFESQWQGTAQLV